MKSILFCIIFSILCFGDTELDQLMNKKVSLQNVVSIETYVTSSTEGTIGSNRVTINILNKEKEMVKFYVLLDQPVIIPSCDFVIKKYNNNFLFKMDNDCSTFLSLSAQKKYTLDIVNRIEKKIDYIYNKGDI